MKGKKILAKGGILATALLVNLLILCAIPRFARQESDLPPPREYDAIRITRYQPQKLPEHLPKVRPEPPAPAVKKLPPAPEPILTRPEPPAPVAKKLPPPPEPILTQTEPPKPIRPKPEIRTPQVQPKIRPAVKPAVAVAPPPPPAPKSESKSEPGPAPEPAVQRPAPAPEPAAKSHSPSRKPAPEKRSSAPAAEIPSQPIRSEFGLEEVDKPPRVVRKIPPDYPYRARRRNLRGMVTVRFLVTEKGDVDRLSVVRADPEGVFEKNVVSAVRRWRFSPGIYEGRPVATWVELPIRFRLNG